MPIASIKLFVTGLLTVLPVSGGKPALAESAQDAANTRVCVNSTSPAVASALIRAN
jgi:hypothetical protein